MTGPGPPTTLSAVGDIDILGRIASSSNATFLVEADLDDDVGSPIKAIYKPERGERPLYDFPPGIWRREVAAYELAKALGWNCIPETVPVDGPLGVGSLQRFVEVDYADHYFTMISEDDPYLDIQLRRICCFDLLANNTDRKAGHCLLDADRHIWGIDNSLCFHAQSKLRTVVWDFAGMHIDADLIDDVSGLLERGLPEPLGELLDPFEEDALCTRARATVREGIFPEDVTGRGFPWPLL